MANFQGASSTSLTGHKRKRIEIPTLSNVSMQPNSDLHSDIPNAIPSDPNDTANGPTRSLVWFEDGNVVLQARGAQFLVHRGVLAHHSPVLRELVHLIHFNLVEQFVDGHPLLFLPDAADELEHLLKALYDPCSFLWPQSVTSETSPMLCAVLKLSTKYKIVGIRRFLLSAFKGSHPTELSLWDSLSPLLSASAQDALSNAFDESSVSFALPTALYACALRGADETASTSLSAKNKDRVLEGIRAIQQEYHSMLMKTLGEYELTVSCFTSRSCKVTARSLYRREMLAPVGGTTHPLCRWDDVMAKKIRVQTSGTDGLLPMGDEQPELCTACMKAFREKWNRVRQNSWRNLPRCFKLPEWQRLEEADAAFQAQL